MTAAAFKALRKLEGKRVSLEFGNREIIDATILSATTDADGSRHLVYAPTGAKEGKYAAGEDLVAYTLIEPV